MRWLRAKGKQRATAKLGRNGRRAATPTVETNATSTNDESAGKFNIHIGDLSQSQVVIGDYNTVTQKVGLSLEGAEKLRGLFEGFRSSVEEEAPPERRGEAVAQAEELERAVVSERPDVGRVRTVLRWFRDNAPRSRAFAPTTAPGATPRSTGGKRSRSPGVGSGF